MMRAIPSVPPRFDPHVMSTRMCDRDAGSCN
jgi:hypothetical protein